MSRIEQERCRYRLHHWPGLSGAMHLADDGLEWTRAYLEKGEDTLACGEGVPGGEFLAWLDRKLKALG